MGGGEASGKWQLGSRSGIRIIHEDGLETMSTVGTLPTYLTCNDQPFEQILDMSSTSMMETGATEHTGSNQCDYDLECGHWL